MTAGGPHLVGLDIGGSKTTVLSRALGAPTVRFEVASANLASVGPEEAGRQLDRAFARISRLADRGPVTAVCAGAAGVDTPEGEERLHRLVADRVSGAPVRIVHDTHLILAAAGVDHGIAAIAGTGSVAWGRDAAGRTARAGGWGYLLGDEGGGYGIARDAVRHVLSRSDSGLPPDPLSLALAAACELTRPDALLDAFYLRTERRYWAGRAGVVFTLAAAGDPVAVAIVDSAARDLARLIGTVQVVLDAPEVRTVVLGGGLGVHQPLLRRRLDSLLADAGLTVRVLDRDPADGALALAARLHLTTDLTNPLEKELIA